MLPEVTAIVFIPLTQGKVAVIDFEDFEKVRAFKWHASLCKNTFYAVYSGYCNGRRTRTFLHRLLLDAPPGKKTDHKDGDGLNNRRGNIRLCSTLQNAQSTQKKRAGATSNFRGVRWEKRRSLWTTQITASGKRIFLGQFQNEEDAARAYDKKAREIFGEFASPNFP